MLVRLAALTIVSLKAYAEVMDLNSLTRKGHHGLMGHHVNTARVDFADSLARPISVPSHSGETVADVHGIF